MKRGLAWSFTHPRAQMIKFLVRFSTSSTINNRLSRNTRCRRGMCRKIRVATRASPRVTRWVCDLYGVFSSLSLFAALVLPGQHIVLGDKKKPAIKKWIHCRMPRAPWSAWTARRLSWTTWRGRGPRCQASPPSCRRGARQGGSDAWAWKRWGWSMSRPGWCFGQRRRKNRVLLSVMYPRLC